MGGSCRVRVVVGAAVVVACDVVVGGAVVVVVLGGAAVVVVVDGSGAGVVVVAGASVGGGGGAGITVTVVLSLGPVMVTVCGGAGLVEGAGVTGADLVSNRLIAKIRATSTAAPAPATLNTSAVRLYQGSRPWAVA